MAIANLGLSYKDIKKYMEQCMSEHNHVSWTCFRERHFYIKHIMVWRGTVSLGQSHREKIWLLAEQACDSLGLANWGTCGTTADDSGGKWQQLGESQLRGLPAALVVE